MLSRNAELKRACAAALAGTLALCIAAVAAGAAAAVPWMLAAAALVALVAALLTRRRYRALAELAAGLDGILHGDRTVSIARMSEGELAVLASELDKMSSRLLLAAEELDREKNLLADSLADVSHQLRTPLTSLALVLELLRDPHLSPTERADKLRLAEGLLSRIEWLVEALLKLARIDAGTVALAHERVDARSLVDTALSPLELRFDLADVAVEKDVAAGAGFIGDAAWTAEALGNILKNCLEHTPAGGTVRIRAWEDALACRIRVQDTGRGFSPDDLPHVFERFYRGQDGTPEPSPAGIGIGLALARELVSAQGGTLTASNAPEGGARFDIVFFKATV